MAKMWQWIGSTIACSHRWWTVALRRVVLIVKLMTSMTIATGLRYFLLKYLSSSHCDNFVCTPLTIKKKHKILIFEASRGVGAQSMPVNRLVVGSIPTWGDEIFIYIYIIISSTWCRGKSAALSSATQHAMPPEFGGKWETECLNTRFPRPTLLCAGYSVKMKKKSRTWIKTPQQDHYTAFNII